MKLIDELKKLTDVQPDLHIVKENVWKILIRYVLQK